MNVVRWRGPGAIAGLLLLGVIGGHANADRPPPELAPDVVEGALWATQCIGVERADQSCNARALAAADPGGLLSDGRYTLLLLDSRVLLRSCAARQSSARVRARGLLHDRGRAMTVFYLEEKCDQDWRPVALPYSGISGAGAEGGDE
jgi:hypothetical protein